MSTEIESLTTDMNTRRTGSGMNPMLVVFAVAALLLAIYAHWRFGQFDGRIDRLKAQLVSVRATQDQIASSLGTLTTRLEQTNASVRNEIGALRELPAQLNELGQNVAELRSRTEAPQRTWAQAEALYLLELADRRLRLEHDVPTAIVALESADARLESVRDPAVSEVRRVLAEELSKLRAVPLPDLPGVMEQLTVLERRAVTLPVLGVPVAAARRDVENEPTAGPLVRALRRISEAFKDLVSLRQVQPGHARLVTEEEESLRRLHLQLLLYTARIAVMQQDRAAYLHALRSADEWLADFFDPRAATVSNARTEIAALAAIDIDPARPQVGAAAQLLRRVYRDSPPKTP